MTDLERISALAATMACMLATGLTAGCSGGGGGGPGSLASDEEWQIRASGARSFTAVGNGTDFESEADPSGMTLKEGVLDDDTAGGTERVELRIDFGTEVDSSSVPTDLMANGTLERFDLTYEAGYREMEEVASYHVDGEDPETYLSVSVESFEHDPMVGTVQSGAEGTFEGKLVDTEGAGEYVQIEGAFDFTSTTSM